MCLADGVGKDYDSKVRFRDEKIGKTSPTWAQVFACAAFSMRLSHSLKIDPPPPPVFLSLLFFFSIDFATSQYPGIYMYVLFLLLIPLYLTYYLHFWLVSLI